MRATRILLPLALTVAALLSASASIRWLLGTPCPYEISERRPAEDRPGQAPRGTLQPGDHCNRLSNTEFRSTPRPAPPPGSGHWPQFRGAGYDNIARDSVPLAETWPDGGPPVVWQREFGEGHAGAAVYDGHVYLMDYDEERDGDLLRCMALDSGGDIWERFYPVKIKRNHGISRTVPAVNEDVVVSMGPKCHVLCVDRSSGDYRWGLDLALDYGTTVPLWYTAQCPLIDDGVAVIAPAGHVLMMGIDCETGKVLWTTPNPDDWAMSHSSVTPMTVGGQRVYVYCAIGGMVAVAADGEARGTILWKTSDWRHQIVAPSPVPLDDDMIFVTAGHGAGSMRFQVNPRDGRSITSLGPIDKTLFACEQQTPLYYRGHLYGVLPKDAGERREQMVCVRPDGNLVWASGDQHRFGLGPYMIADGKILAFSDRGVLHLLTASSTAFELLARHEVIPDGVDTWAPLALVDGFLLLRDSRRMLCLDLRADRTPREDGDGTWGTP